MLAVPTAEDKAQGTKDQPKAVSDQVAGMDGISHPICLYVKGKHFQI